MSNAFIQISPDSSGKKVQVFENVVGGQTVEATAVSLVNASGTPVTSTAALPVVYTLGAGANATRVNSSAYESSRVLKSSPGTLISLQGYSNAAFDQWLLFFDSTTVPGVGAVPVWFIPIIGSSYFAIDVPLTGVPFTTGISISNSPNPTARAVGANNVWFLAVVQ